MVVVLRDELRAIDEAHGTLQALVKGTRLSELRRSVRQGVDELPAPHAELGHDCGERLVDVSLGQRSEVLWASRGVDWSPISQIVQTLLPELFHVGQVPDVLSDGPRPVHSAMRDIVVQVVQKRPQSRDQAPQPLDEIDEHPRRVDEGEATFGPRRPLELGRCTGTCVPWGIHASPPVRRASERNAAHSFARRELGAHTL